MFPVWTAVKVETKTKDHDREGQAGVVHATNHVAHPDSVVVKFDKDGTCEEVAVVDLVTL
jgi:hypothetical protein